jgi:hypothetical protein
MMKVITYLVLLLSVISVIKSHPKGDKLRQLTLSSDRGLIVLDAETYKEYVMSHPRPYDIVILYTLSRKCTLCETVINEFIQVSDSFRDANGFKPDMISRKRAVFFAILYYSEETMHIFKELKFPSMTNILYTTPQNIQINNLGETYIEYNEDYVISYNDKSDRIYALKMIEFANAKSQRKVPLKKNPIEYLIYFLLFVGAIFCGFSIYKNFKPILLSPILWVSGSNLILIICMGGVVYNVLHGTPFARYDRDGNIVQFIHPEQRSQYAGEGVLMSSLFVIGGTLLYSFILLNRIQGYTQHKFASFAVIIFIILDVQIIFAIYTVKARWYNPTFLPPGNYITGPLINDQGNSF